jgi:hypothetical protein
VTHKTKKKVQNGLLGRSNGTNWVSSIGATGSNLTLSGSLSGTFLSCSSGTGSWSPVVTLPSTNTTSSGNKFLRSDGQWVDLPTMSTEKDKYFEFKVAGKLIFFSLPGSARIERINYYGIFPFGVTCMKTTSYPSRKLFWFTSEVEHNAIVRACLDGYHGQQFIESL